ncbi:MAG: hypothetical protein HC848_01320 [Limnobacter sp.]|nr:hypothetical protein [Limnobacter sp.]
MVVQHLSPCSFGPASMVCRFWRDTVSHFLTNARELRGAVGPRELGAIGVIRQHRVF